MAVDRSGSLRHMARHGQRRFFLAQAHGRNCRGGVLWVLKRHEKKGTVESGRYDEKIITTATSFFGFQYPNIWIAIGAQKFQHTWLPDFGTAGKQTVPVIAVRMKTRVFARTASRLESVKPLLW